MAYQEPISLDWLVQKRREIHAWPEPGWAEFVSSARAIQYLEKEGFQVLCGREVINENYIRGAKPAEIEEGLKFARERGVSEELLARMNGVTGVVGIYDTGRPGPVIGFRCELDCIPVTETKDPEHIPNKEGFASQHAGYMHACSHDGPQAVLMGLATWIKANADKLCGKVKIIYQPAEEGGRGGRPMAESGILDDLDFLYCGHFGCDVPAGEVITAPEKFLCSTKFDLKYTGSPSHAAMQPELGRNALMAAATASLSLMSLPRHGLGMTRVNVGTLRAGEGRNVIASKAEMQCEVRGETAKINEDMFNEAMTRAKAAAAMYGCEFDCKILGETLDFNPDPEARDNIAQAAEGVSHVEKITAWMNFNGSEDATVLAQRVQKHGGKCSYVVVGSELKAGHHQCAFDFEEKRLISLYEIYRNLVIHHMLMK